VATTILLVGDLNWELVGMLLSLRRVAGISKLAVWGYLLTAVFSSQALAYVGPGLGAGAMASLFGIFMSVAMLAFGAIWYPIKKAFKLYVFQSHKELPNVDKALAVRK
jgi:hypothetical protein